MPVFERDELQSIIQECLGDGFTNSRDDTGFIDPDASRRELLRFAAFNFLQNPDMAFYLADLFKGDLEDAVESLVDALQEARDVVDDTIKSVTIPDTEYLNKASTALGRASTSLSEDEVNSPVSIIRARSNIGDYTEDLESQLITSGNMSQTASLAKKTIRTAISNLQDNVDAIIADVDTLIGMSVDTSLLERIYLTVTIDKLKELLDGRINTLVSAADKVAIEAELRDVYLFLKVTNSLLRTEVGFPSPEDTRASGTGAPANTAANLAFTIEPARLTGTASLPLIFDPSGSPITIEVNGADQVVTAPSSTRGRVTGYVIEPYSITLSVSDDVEFNVDTYTLQSFTINSGIGRTAEQVGEDIEAGTSPAGIVNCTSTAEADTVVWVESVTYGDGSRITIGTGTNSINSTIGIFDDQEATGSHTYPVNALSVLGSQLTGCKVYTDREEKSTGSCTADTGATDKFDLPANEGLNVAVDDTLLIKDGPNAGAFKITDVTSDKITVDRDLWDNTDTESREYIVTFEPLVLESTKLDALDSSLRSSIATAFGFPTTRVYGSVSDFEDTNGFPFVRIGDVLNFGGSTYTVSENFGTRLVVSPLLGMDAGSGSYTIDSTDASAFATLRSALQSWKTSFELAYPNFNNLNSYSNRVVVGPSIPHRTQLKNELDAILAYFTGGGSLEEILETYSARELPAGERLLKLLEERKSLKARDFLKSLDFDSFFDFNNPMSYEQDAFDKLAAMLRKYRPAESVGDEIDDEILEDASMPGVEFELEDPELLEPEDEYFV
jgi:hypothetical protein